LDQIVKYENDGYLAWQNRAAVRGIEQK